MKDTLNVPPFPPLEWDEDRWVGLITLEAWAGFRSVEGCYVSVDSTTVSDGSACLNITMPNATQSIPSAEQIAAYHHLIEHQEATRDSILQAFFAFYPEQQPLYDYDAGEADKYMPNLQSAEQLKTLIGLSDVHISSVSKSGLASVGFEFVCTWDDEHGLGAMTHAGRVVEIGGADVVLDWAAIGDAAKGE